MINIEEKIPVCNALTFVLEKTSIVNVVACGSEESLDGGSVFRYVPWLNLRDTIVLFGTVYCVRSCVPDYLL
jgi:hypothetical protein